MEREEIYDLLAMANNTERSSYWRCQAISDYLLDHLVQIQDAELQAAADAERLEAERGVVSGRIIN